MSMQKRIFLGLLSAIFLNGCKSTENTSKNSDPVIETIGGKPIHASDFAYVYNKNNSNAENAYTRESLKEYLELYTNFRLKVSEAEKLGLDTAEAFNKELDGYKKQLAQPYLTEKGVSEQLAKEAYERMKEEVNASHILITVNPDADPKDTLAAYNKIVEIRNKAIGGESFEKLAEEFSQDPSAKANKGSLGYFSALQMVYPFENAAYNTPKGQISAPVRTRFGYHTLKVNDRRKSQGQVRAAHIMIRATQNMPAADSIAASQKIQEIYNRLQKGEDWKQLAEQFSEDANSKSKGGELPWFSTGRMIPAFEETAFALTAKDEISKPFHTPYGWHIIKLLERKELEPYSELEANIKSKVAKDSRSDLNKTVLLQRLKKENNFIEHPQALEMAVLLADSTLLNGSWNKKAEPSKNAALFSISSKNYTINDFFEYLASSAKKSREKKTASPSQVMKNLYKAYAEEKLIGYEEAHLEDKYRDYKMLVKEYRDGILLFQLMDEKVWSKAINDTTGLKDFFNKNQQKYKWDTRAHASIYSVPNEATLTKLKEALKNDKFPVKTIILENSYFEAGKSELSDKAQSIAEDALAKLRKDKSYVLEITGTSDPKETAAKGLPLSFARAAEVRRYLISRGADSTRLIVTDGGKQTVNTNDKKAGTRTAKASDANKEVDRKVSYTLYSRSGKSLEATFNENAPLTLQVTEGIFQKGENNILDQAEWKPGTQTLNKNDRIYYVVISKIEEPRLKSFEEARGITISEYQSFLEQEWLKTLKQKYPVVINEAEVEKLIKKQQ
jgi:peptidyl-prolyl cis-trans isomerase SurA